eukprot:2606181-Karenia_brevis.AAC.1
MLVINGQLSGQNGSQQNLMWRGLLELTLSWTTSWSRHSGCTEAEHMAPAPGSPWCQQQER